MNLYLIGYRGVGKSTLAALLAGRLGRTWIDADVELERRAGRTIAEIFASQGEQAFRDLESLVLAELSQRDGLVVALGGGVVLREENRRALAGGKVVWLTADPETIHRRLAADHTTADRRPSLTSLDGLDEIRELLAQREPLYRQCADLVVDAQSATPEQIAERISAELA